MKISVIVPVYNSEKYIKKCILSVIKQTYKNWELILIDDGSKDRSVQIIDELSKRDNRIRVIHQKNSGPGIARNRGIEEANGDFVVFLDSDDFLDEEYFTLLSELTQKYDLIYIDANQVTETGKLIKKEKMSKYKKYDRDKIIRSQMTGKMAWGGWRKAVRLELIKENGIQYTKHSIGEEALYSFQLVNLAKNIGFLDKKPVYYYVNHENSQSKIECDDPWGGVVIALKNYLKKINLYEEYANTLNSFNVAATIVSIDRIIKNYPKKDLKKQIKNRMDIFFDYNDSMYKFDNRNLAFKAKIFIPFLKLGITYPIILCSKIKKYLLVGNKI